jgi:hypothetical protein
MGLRSKMLVSAYRLLLRMDAYIIWIILLINGSRYLPTLLFPISKKLRMQGKFSLGFLVGIFYSIMGRKIEYN